MSRAADGTCTAPTGNPVVTGSTISSTVHNNTVSDTYSVLSDSLSRSGKGPMTAPLEIVDGTDAAPGLSFDAEPASGLYRGGGADVRMGVNGTSGGITKWLATYFGVIVGKLKLLATSTTGNQITSAAADAANVVAVTLDTDNALTQGKLLSVQNATSEKFALDYTGEPSVQGGLACGVAVKTDADQTESAGTMTSVTSMAFAVVANGIYVWECVFPGSAGASNGLQIQYTGPAAPTAVSIGFVTGGNGLYSATAFSSAIGPTSTTTTAKVMNRSDGILVNGANAGTVQLQFKMAGGGATNAVVYKGAFLRWRRLN